MKIVVGLGNPGKRYENTPHSVGFEVVEALARRLDARLRGSFWFRASIGRARLVSEDDAGGRGELLLVKPRTFMNNSGPAVADVLRYYGVAPDEMIVVVDDADLELGVVRLRRGGSSGGHRGLQSVIESVGTEKFGRARIGIGRGERGSDLMQHVLRKFAPAEKDLVDEVVERATEAVLCALASGMEDAMNRFNGSA